MARLEQHKQVVVGFIEAMSAGDSERAAQFITQATFTLAKGFGKFAGVRTYETILGTIGAFRALMPEGMGVNILSVTAEGDRVAVEFEGDGRLINGSHYHNQYCMIFTLADGRIHHVHEYFCTIHADEVLWPLVEGA